MANILILVYNLVILWFLLKSYCLLIIFCFELLFFTFIQLNFVLCYLLFNCWKIYLCFLLFSLILNHMQKFPVLIYFIFLLFVLSPNLIVTLTFSSCQALPLFHFYFLSYKCRFQYQKDPFPPKEQSCPCILDILNET